MSRSVQLLRVFLGSPSDVAEERDVAASVVAELNLTVARHLGVHLELLRWETDAAPGFAEDAQAVINAQIVEDYDIFLGVLHKRFGSPTLRADSGTEEEFDRAFQRFEANPKAIRILFYFKQKEFLPTESDLQQMTKVLEFKKRLGKLGGLYWEYKEVSDFAAYLRIHLAKYLQEWGKSWGEPPSSALAAAGAPTPPPNPPVPTKVLVRRREDDLQLEEMGIIELGELSEQRMQPALEAANRIIRATEEFGAKISSHAAEMNSLMAQESPPEPIYVKAVVDRAARTIDSFATTMDAEVTEFAQRFRDAFQTFSRALALVGDFGEEGIQEKKRTLEELRGAIATMQSTRDEIAKFSGSIEQLPRLTTPLTRAKMRAAAALTRLSNEVDSLQSAARGIIEAAERGC